MKLAYWIMVGAMVIIDLIAWLVIHDILRYCYRIPKYRVYGMLILLVLFTLLVEYLAFY
jgi:hypothetical protein